MPAANMKKMRIISIPGLAKEAMLRLRVENRRCQGGKGVIEGVKPIHSRQHQYCQQIAVRAP